MWLPYFLCFAFYLCKTGEGTLSGAKQVADFFSSGSQLYVGGRFFAANSESLGQKVSVLNAITLAKGGRPEEAAAEIANMAVQVAMYDLPNTVRQAVGFWKEISTEGSAFVADTVDASKKYMKVGTIAVEQAVEDFSNQNPNPSREAKQGMRGRIQEIMTKNTKSKVARQRVLDALDGDIGRAKRIAASSSNAARKLKAGKISRWFDGFKAELKKNPGGKFLGTKVGNVGVLDPMVDIVGVGLSINGLIVSSNKKDKKGIALNSVGLIASVAGIVGWFLMVGGVPWAGPVNVIIGLIAAIATLFIDLFWPQNPAIDMANELSKLAIEDLTTTLSALQDPSYKDSFGWVYQANTGIFGLRSISPDTSLTFRQPTCASGSGIATPCAPKTNVFDHKRYLVLSKRTSTDSDFPLKRPYDFLGRPKDGKFCGNTISMNTVPYYNTVTRRNSGLSHTLRALDIDTTTIPNYEAVDSSAWDSQRDKQGDESSNSTNFQLRHLIINRFSNHTKVHKTFRKKSHHHHHGVKSRRNVANSEDNSQHTCEQNSDRIEIDEMRNLDIRPDKTIKIRTGEGKDIFSIGGRVEDISKLRTNLLDVDLGSTDEANVFSVGYLLDVKGSRGELLAGVKFDNANGQGKVCYLKNDLQSYKCVGNVRGVTVFKGSRFHDTVIIGGHGPFTVIQNYGANEYHYKMDNLENVLKTRNAVDDMCPGEWSHHKVGTNDYCYQLIKTATRNFDLAQESCLAQGASLAIITNQEENDFVKSVKPGFPERWIGLVDNYKKRSFRWVDGTEFTESSYTNFYRKRWQPVDAREDCILMRDDGQWMYAKCHENPFSFTCKKVVQDSTSCSDAGWQHHDVQGNSYCYRVFGNENEEERRTWFGAWEHCREQESADLTSIVDEEENNFVAGLTSHSQYIGLEDTWKKRSFFWADGSAMKVSSWATGEPDDNEYQEHCVLGDGGKWKDWNCKNAERFTCQKEAAQTGSSCESDWIIHGGSCYLSVSSGKSWSEATAHCTNLDGWLAKPDTSEKNNYISRLHNDEASWIGLRDNKYDRIFDWTDKSALEYTNWLDRLPDFEFKYQYQHCVMMDGQGRWIPSICKDSEHYAKYPICKKKALPRVTYEIMDISRGGRPVVKIVIPDSMSDATVQYDKQEMFVDIKHPTLGHVARIDISRDIPEAPDVYKIRGSSSSCVRHTPLL